MALQASALPREFFCNGSRISDPDPRMEIDQVRELLTPSYPEIATATMTGPEDTGTALRYTFSRAIGSKGCSEQSRPRRYERSREMTSPRHPSTDGHSCRWTTSSGDCAFS
jgi:PRTRC genetic system protein C